MNGLLGDDPLGFKREILGDLPEFQRMIPRANVLNQPVQQAQSDEPSFLEKMAIVLAPTAYQNVQNVRASRQLQSQRQNALQSSPNDLAAAAASLFQSGDIEGGNSLLESAKQQRSLTQGPEVFSRTEGVVNPATGKPDVLITYRDGSREFANVDLSQSPSSVPGRLPQGYMWNAEAGRAEPIPGVGAPIRASASPSAATRPATQRPTTSAAPSAATRQPPSASQGSSLPSRVPLPSGKVNATQMTNLGFADRMLNAERLIEQVPSAFPNLKNVAAGSIPFVGDIVERFTMTPEQQQFQNAANEWIRAKLRKESGAAIGDDEMRQEFITYFPQPGDGPDVIRQKAQLRRIAIESLARQSGNENFRLPTLQRAPTAPNQQQRMRYVNGRLEPVR